MVEDAIEVRPVADSLCGELVGLWVSLVEAPLVVRLGYLGICMKDDVAVPILS